MSVHFSLAKKVLAHLKDIFRMVANENGADFKREEQELFAAVKEAASSELGKIEDELQTGLQSWQMAPSAGNATSIGGGADLGDNTSDSDNSGDSTDAPAEEAGQSASDPTDSTSAPIASGETSEPSASAPASDTADTGAKSDKNTADEAPAATVQNPAPSAPVQFGDPDATAPTGDNSVGSLPPAVSVGPETGSADFHGPALGSESTANVGGAAPLPSGAPASSVSSDSVPGGSTYVPPTDAAPAQAALGGTDPQAAADAADAQANAPQQIGKLDAQQGEGTPAAEADTASSSSSEPSASAPSASSASASAATQA